MLKQGENMEKQTWFIALVAVLVVVAAVQAFQLSGLKEKLVGGAVTTAQAPASSEGVQQAKLPSNLDNLPSMVGGC